MYKARKTLAFWCDRGPAEQHRSRPRNDDPGYSINPDQAIVNRLHAGNILCSDAQGCAFAFVGDDTLEDDNPVGHDDIDATAGPQDCRSISERI